ncbi:hypothetical protein LEMLEM_LOCUS20746 [Lemmus lemmus]
MPTNSKLRDRPLASGAPGGETKLRHSGERCSRQDGRGKSHPGHIQ